MNLSLDHMEPDDFWLDDDTEERVNATTGERTATQRVPCPGCGIVVHMPADWNGDDQDEALCNECYDEEQRT